MAGLFKNGCGTQVLASVKTNELALKKLFELSIDEAVKLDLITIKTLIRAFQSSLELLHLPMLSVCARNVGRLHSLNRSANQIETHAAISSASKRALKFSGQLQEQDVNNFLLASQNGLMKNIPNFYCTLEQRAIDLAPKVEPGILLDLVAHYYKTGSQSTQLYGSSAAILYPKVKVIVTPLPCRILETFGMVNYRDRQLLIALSARIARDAAELNNKQVASSMWCFAKLQHKDEYCLHALSSRALKLTKTFTLSELNNIISAFGKGYVEENGPLVNKILKRTTDLTPEMDVSDVNYLISNCSKQRIEPLELMKAVSERADKLIPETPAKMIGVLSNEFAKLQYKNPSFMVNLAKRAAVVAPEMTAVDISKTMNALTHLQVNVPEAVNNMNTRAFTIIETMRDVDLGLLMNAFAKGNIKDIPLITAMIHHAAHTPSRMSPNALSQIFNALARLRLQPKDTSKLLERVQTVAPLMDSQHIPVILNAYVILGLDNKDVFETLMSQVPRILSDRRIKGQGISMIYNACVRQNYPINHNIIQQSLKVLENMNSKGTLSAQSMALITQGLGRFATDLHLAETFVRAVAPTLIPKTYQESYLMLILSGMAAMRLNDFSLISKVLTQLETFRQPLLEITQVSVGYSLSVLNYPDNALIRKWLERCVLKETLVDNRALSLTLYMAAIYPTNVDIMRKLWIRCLSLIYKNDDIDLDDANLPQIHQAFWALKVDMPELANELERNEKYQKMLEISATAFRKEAEDGIVSSNAQKEVMAYYRSLGYSVEEEYMVPGVNLRVDGWFKGTKTVVEVDGVYHFGVVNKELIVGKSIIKRKILRGLGYNILVVKVRDYHDMKDMGEAKTFLSALLNPHLSLVQKCKS